VLDEYTVYADNVYNKNR
jgi:hypothetical protein